MFAALDPGCPLHESFPADYMVLFRFARLVIVPDAQTSEEAHQALLDHGLDRSGSLARAIGPERAELLGAEIDDLVPPMIVPFLRPTWALEVLVLALAADAYGVDASDGRISPTHDAVSRRRMSGAPLLGLYDHDELDRWFTAVAPSATDALRGELDALDAERAAARAVLAAYRAGDEAVLIAANHDAPPGVERFADVSRTASRRMRDAHAETLEAELRAGNALAVLSVTEVLGDDGVLADLRSHGLTVTRISVAAPSP